MNRSSNFFILIRLLLQILLLRSRVILKIFFLFLSSPPLLSHSHLSLHRLSLSQTSLSFVNIHAQSRAFSPAAGSSSICHYSCPVTINDLQFSGFLSPQKFAHGITSARNIHFHSCSVLYICA